MQGCSYLPLKHVFVSDVRDVHAEHSRTEAAAISDAYARWRAVSTARAARSATGDLRDNIPTPFHAFSVCGGCMKECRAPLAMNSVLLSPCLSLPGKHVLCCASPCSLHVMHRHLQGYLLKLYRPNQWKGMIAATLQF